MNQKKNHKYLNNITTLSKNKKKSISNNIIKKKPNYNNKQNTVLNIKNNISNINNKNINNNNELVTLNQYSINPYNYSTTYSPMNNQITIRLKRKLSDFILSKNNNSNISNENINNSNLNSNNKPKKRLNLSNPENHKIKSNSVIHIKSKTISFYDNDDNIYNKYIKKTNNFRQKNKR